MKSKIIFCLYMFLCVVFCSSCSKSFSKNLSKAEAGDAEAQLKVGKAYYFGWGVKEDHDKAVTWISKSIQQGNDKAVEWAHKNSKKGDPGAQLLMGWIYHEGFGVPINYQKAAEFYSKAAFHGNAIAQRRLGFLYNYEVFTM